MASEDPEPLPVVIRMPVWWLLPGTSGWKLSRVPEANHVAQAAECVVGDRIVLIVLPSDSLEPAEHDGVRIAVSEAISADAVAAFEIATREGRIELVDARPEEDEEARRATWAAAAVVQASWGWDESPVIRVVQGGQEVDVALEHPGRWLATVRPLPAADPTVFIRYTFTRSEWWPVEWPAFFFWGLLPFLLSPLAISAAITDSGWWVLTLVPIWLILGRKFLGILIFLLRGKEDIVLQLKTGYVIGVSATDGRYWQPIFGASLEDQGPIWMIYGNGGGMHLPVPKHAITDRERDLLFEHVNQLKEARVAAPKGDR